MNTTASEAESSRGVLDGVVIVDFTHELSGPFASMMLADLGATVIKVESPLAGDNFRNARQMVDGLAPQFAAVNRGKYGIVLDLKSPDGLAAARELAQLADVVLNNYRPGVLEKLGLGAEALRQANPRLIYAQISGFGQAGAMAGRPAFDPVVQATTGLMSLVGEPEAPPQKAGVNWGDLVAGLFAAFGIMSALFDRERTRKGQVVDVAMFDAMFFMQMLPVVGALATGKAAPRTGQFAPIFVPTGTFPTSDGHIEICTVTQAFWRSLCRALGRDEWVDDPKFAEPAARLQNREELIAGVCEVTRTRTRAEWGRVLTECDVPHGEVLTTDEAIRLPVVEERELLASLGVGELRAPINPFRLSDAPQRVRKPAPHRGADTASILQSLLGFDEERIARAMGLQREV